MCVRFFIQGELICFLSEKRWLFIARRYFCNGDDVRKQLAELHTVRTDVFLRLMGDFLVSL